MSLYETGDHSAVCIGTWIRSGKSGVRFPVQAGDFSQNVRPTLGPTRSAVELVIEVISLRVKR
jgi:hypothetical protein